MGHSRLSASERNSRKAAIHIIEPIYLRIVTAVKLKGIWWSTSYDLISAGEIETVKFGRSTFIVYRSLKRLCKPSPG